MTYYSINIKSLKLPKIPTDGPLCSCSNNNNQMCLQKFLESEAGLLVWTGPLSQHTRLRLAGDPSRALSLLRRVLVSASVYIEESDQFHATAT